MVRLGLSYGRLLVASALLTLALSSGASAATRADKTIDFVNDFRRDMGIRSKPLVLAEDPLAKKILLRLIDQQRDLEEGSKMYRQAGGKVPLSYAYGDILAGRPNQDDWATLLDPRARELVLTPYEGYNYIAIRLDPQAHWNRPIAFPPGGRMDIQYPKSSQGVWFPGSARSRFTVSRKIGRSWTKKRKIRPVIVGRGWGGAFALDLMGLGDMALGGIDLAAGSTYRIGIVGGPSVQIHTTAWQSPAASFRFGSNMTRRYRRIFLRQIARANRPARRLIAKVDGLLYIGLAPKKAHYSMAGMIPRGGRPGHILMQRDHLLRLGAHTTLHELGHIIQEEGIDPYAMKQFKAAFRRSPRWQKCFRHYLGFCSEEEEIWADQFAYWALGEKKLSPGTGYGDPPLLSGRAFGRLMKKYWAYRL